MLERTKSKSYAKISLHGCVGLILLELVKTDNKKPVLSLLEPSPSQSATHFNHVPSIAKKYPKLIILTEISHKVETFFSCVGEAFYSLLIKLRMETLKAETEAIVCTLVLLCLKTKLL